MKRMGFSDRQLGALRGETEDAVRARRWALGVRPVVQDGRHLRRRVPVGDAVPLRQLRRGERGAAQRAAESVVILGSGPNRIGQGVEFDYCCVRAVLALREQGYETIMINSNPETVSTDFDISDKLYFEPLTLEDVLEIVQREQPRGRDRAARRADAAQAHARRSRRRACRSSARRPTRSTSPRTGGASTQIARELGIAQPPNGTATSVDEARRGRRAHRLSGARAAVVRAGRARDADRATTQPSLREYFDDGGARVAKSARC